MRIKSIESFNFKSFEKMDVKDLGSINTLIGKNSSGKTNIIQVIRVFFNLISNHSQGIAINLPAIMWYSKDTKNNIKMNFKFILTEDEIKKLNISESEIRATPL